jgi:transcriptional regulator with XRE-family HTH domain
LGQRLYAARNRAALSVAEAAMIVGVAPDVLTTAEREQPVSRADAARIERLITDLNQT